MTSMPRFEQRRALQTRPDEKPVMFQSWRKLLFLHWKFDPIDIQELLPAGLTVDTFDGNAWVGIVPFYMRNIRPVWSRSIPYISNFLELNVRTYAYDENGNPGVWFLSLDASRLLAVQVARRFFHLPYYWAKMSAAEVDSTINYESRRLGDPAKRTCSFQYRGTGTAAAAKEETLEFFLVERYLLFSQTKSNGIATGQVHHSPYQIQLAEASSFCEPLFELNGITSPNRPPDHALYSEGVDVEVFPLKIV
ncbi:DUF2071 domain-containing protein [Planctomicrobium sp.]|nr:DUF2071 domain-containing protein [Planctomicrobium sp.]MBT5020591.1 DUF2071 domain-containing protein [Planctomicrobium sp.]MDB4744026.1 DUF2071 domain-containing protein [Planctomicrobium sp.]MDB4802462.1 DUF2071 domain-containing protein [bacterium]